MEPHDDVPAHEQEPVVCSDNDSDTRDVSEESCSLPIHTIRKPRLSTASSRPESISQHHDQAFIEPFPEDDVLAVQEELPHEEREIAHDVGLVERDDEIIASDVPLPDDIMDPRHSSVSGESLEEEDESTITLRSRSSSSGTFSSSDGSAQVDWDELEKEEVEAPRDEGSDEVRVLKSKTPWGVVC